MNRNHIIQIDAEKAFNKVHHLLLIKNNNNNNNNNKPLKGSSRTPNFKKCNSKLLRASKKPEMKSQHDRDNI